MSGREREREDGGIISCPFFLPPFSNFKTLINETQENNKSKKQEEERWRKREKEE